jgi:cardiolipin synthase
MNIFAGTALKGIKNAKRLCSSQLQMQILSFGTDGKGPPSLGSRGGKGGGLPGVQGDTKSGSYVYKKESWFNVPNSITVARCIASPGLTYAIVNDMKGVALTGCILAAFTDWLDGYIARNYDQQTVLGGIIDPVADKIVIGALAAGLSMKGLIPMELVSLIIGRDLFLVSAGLIIRVREKPAGTPFFDTTYSATFEIVPSTLSKVNTVNQFLLITITLGQFAFDIPQTLEFMQPLWYLTGATTLGSLAGYLDGSGIKRLSKSGEARGTKPKDD